MVSLAIHPLLLAVTISGDGRPELQLGRHFFFLSCPCTLLVTIFILIFLPSYSGSASYFILVVPGFCVFLGGKTFAHAFHITYGHTEWYLLFSDSTSTCAQDVFCANLYKYELTSKPVSIN